MIFFGHPQAGGCRTGDGGEAMLTNGNRQPVRQMLMNKRGEASRRSTAYPAYPFWPSFEYS